MIGRLAQEQVCWPHWAMCLLLVSQLGGCDNLDRFDTPGDAAYCGELVAPTFAQDGLLPDDTDEKAEARLKLDLDNAAKHPGTLWMSDAKWGLCTPQPLFDTAPLRAIEQVDNDPIATLDFGEGREHSFFAWVDSTCQGTMLSVVSLMRNGGVELRLFKPAPESMGRVPAAERAGFGVFLLKRRDKGCQF
ncbi:MAG: hypothetical protein JW940_02455 [Polyangiaceae bacterium]|nr:hypothetical protein [Polyangiaceae bacterium]